MASREPSSLQRDYEAALDRLAAASHRLAGIESSFAWSLVRSLRSLRERVAPDGTRGARLVRLGLAPRKAP